MEVQVQWMTSPYDHVPQPSWDEKTEGSGKVVKTLAEGASIPGDARHLGLVIPRFPGTPTGSL